MVDDVRLERTATNRNGFLTEIDFSHFTSFVKRC